MKRMLTTLLLATAFLAANAQMPNPNKVQKKAVKKATDTVKHKANKKAPTKDMPNKDVPTKKVPDAPTKNMPGDHEH